MKMILLNVVYETKEKILHLTLLIDKETKYFDVFVKQSGQVEYLTHEEELSAIRYLNVHHMMKLNRIVKAIKNSDSVEFPVLIGEF